MWFNCLKSWCLAFDSNERFNKFTFRTIGWSFCVVTLTLIVFCIALLTTIPIKFCLILFYYTFRGKKGKGSASFWKGAECVCRGTDWHYKPPIVQPVQTLFFPDFSLKSRLLYHFSHFPFIRLAWSAVVEYQQRWQIQLFWWLLTQCHNYGLTFIRYSIAYEDDKKKGSLCISIGRSVHRWHISLLAVVWRWTH